MIEIGNWRGETHFDILGPEGSVRVSVIEDGRTYAKRKKATMSTVKTGSMGGDVDEMKRLEKTKTPPPPTKTEAPKKG